MPKKEDQLTESILGTGVALYFLIRIWLGVRYKFLGSGVRERKISKRNLAFAGIDLAIFTAVILQLNFPQFGKMSLSFSSEPVKMFGISLFVIGVFLSNWGRIILGKNWRPAIVSEKIDRRQRLVVASAPFSAIRHPIYSGMVLMGFGFELSLLNWLFIAIIFLSVLLYRQARSEERMLEEVFSQYKQYRKNTKMFFPKIV